MRGLRCRVVAALVGAMATGACDRRPIEAVAALPAPGTIMPAFTFPRYGGADSVRSADLRGTPAIVALWSTHCPYQGPWVSSFDSLARAYTGHGVRVVVLADDEPGPALDAALSRASWHGATSDIGVASGALRGLFDRSADAPERAGARVEFVLPGFLLVGPDGRVVRRAWGPVSSFRPALDSLLRRSPAA